MFTASSQPNYWWEASAASGSFHFFGWDAGVFLRNAMIEG